MINNQEPSPFPGIIKTAVISSKWKCSQSTFYIALFKRQLLSETGGYLWTLVYSMLLCKRVTRVILLKNWTGCVNLKVRSVRWQNISYAFYTYVDNQSFIFFPPPFSYLLLSISNTESAWQSYCLHSIKIQQLFAFFSDL
jgi:hypothetical protein